MKPLPFTSAVKGIADSIILLDVDGTLLPDGADTLTADTIHTVRNLAQVNRVYLVSNGSDRARVERFARECAVEVAPAGVPAGKPYPKAAEGIPRDRPIIVVGDKVLTDGLFAQSIGGAFIQVESDRSGKETLFIKLSYIADKAVSWFL
jgi:predicted HAD superfamily phosphohydrolase YqeG